MTPTLRTQRRLKDRMSARRLFKRREKMMAKQNLKEKVHELQMQHAMTRGGVNTTARGIEMVFRSERLTRRAVYAVVLYMVASESHRLLGVSLSAWDTGVLALACIVGAGSLYALDSFRRWRQNRAARARMTPVPAPSSVAP